jgi:peroxiredoxin
MKYIIAPSVTALVALAAFLSPLHAADAVIGQAAPGFMLVDSNGKKQSLSDYKGKVVVLEWTNFDCPFVHKWYGSGNMQKVQADAVSKGVVWLSINSSAPGNQGFFEGPDLTNRIAKEGSKATAYLLDPKGTVGKSYGAKTTPNMFVINKDGVLVYEGAIDSIKSADAEDIAKSENYVKAAVDATLAGKPVATPKTEPYGCGIKY